MRERPFANLCMELSVYFARSRAAIINRLTGNIEFALIMEREANETEQRIAKISNEF